MNPIHELGALFEAVQMARVYPDGKTFPDCRPRRPLTEIATAYAQQRTAPGFDLPVFCSAHFDLPPEAASDYCSDATHSLGEHIAALWPLLTRPATAPLAGAAPDSLLPLPYPYVVPGGRFRELYYWDSYFTLLGLAEDGQTELVQHMVANFAHLIERHGYVPNGNRSYYLGRSQPPFFALMVELLAQQRGEQVWLTYLPALQREHGFWMQGAAELAAGQAARRVLRLRDGTLLNRYWDAQDTPRPESYREDVELAHGADRPAAQLYRDLRAACESGWDFSSRWLRDGHSLASIRTTELAPVDLNSLLWNLEQRLAQASRLAGLHKQASTYQQAADARAQAIRRHCWSGSDRYFVDYDSVSREPAAALTLAAVFPLFFGLATTAQAEQVAQRLETDFLQTGGLRTSLVQSGQQWDAPNGWAPLQWMAFKGLQRYGFERLAQAVRAAWLRTCASGYATSGKLMEKYDVSGGGGLGGGGEYPNQDGFGWTNGVIRALQAQAASAAEINL